MSQLSILTALVRGGMTPIAAYEQAQSESAAEIADMQSALNVMGVSVNE